MNKKLHIEQADLLVGLNRLNNRTNLVLQMSGLLQEHVVLNQRLSAHIIALNQEYGILYASKTNPAVSKSVPGTESQGPDEDRNSPGSNGAPESSAVSSPNS